MLNSKKESVSSKSRDSPMAEALRTRMSMRVPFWASVCHSVLIDESLLESLLRVSTSVSEWFCLSCEAALSSLSWERETRMTFAAWACAKASVIP